MEVFRICAEPFSKSLAASGIANRWNMKGQFVIYAGSTRSLSTLELVVHKASIVPAILYKVLVISITDNDNLIKQIYTKDLPLNWRSLSTYSQSQKTGSDWYTNEETLLLKIPSAIIVNEYNYAINTTHPDFKKHVKLVRTEDYFLDLRLLQ